jgi:hypothetical protein
VRFMALWPDLEPDDRQNPAFCIRRQCRPCGDDDVKFRVRRIAGIADYDKRFFQPTIHRAHDAQWPC